jgi:hypothetical protein
MKVVLFRLVQMDFHTYHIIFFTPTVRFSLRVTLPIYKRRTIQDVELALAPRGTARFLKAPLQEPFQLPHLSV